MKFIKCPFCETPKYYTTTELYNQHLETIHFSTAKETTMNTYTITVNGIAEQPIQGTAANTISGGLRILDGDQVVAAYRFWDSYRVERDVDKVYVDKINALENNLKDTWEVVKELEKDVVRLESISVQDNSENERLENTITELRKQRDETKAELNALYGKMREYADTDNLHDACPGMIYFEKMHTTYMCGLPEGHTESHRHIQDGIVWL